MDTPEANTPPVTRQTEPLAIVSFVLSLIGWAGPSLIMWIPAIICGHIARSKIRENPALQGDGFALSGLLISYIGIIIGIVFIILFAGLFVFHSQTVTSHPQIHILTH